MFKVSRVGQDLDAAALLIRNSPTFMVVSLDGGFRRKMKRKRKRKGRNKTRALLCNLRETHGWSTTAGHDRNRQKHKQTDNKRDNSSTKNTRRYIFRFPRRGSTCSS